MSEFETEIPRYRREGIAPEPLYELHLDEDHVLILHGRVIEMLRANQSASDLTTRFHVRHIAVEMKPKRNGNHQLRMGLRRDGGVWNLCDAEVTPEKIDDVQRFFEQAKKQAAA